MIDPTEALVAIDVNSGSFRGGADSADENAFKLNCVAAKEMLGNCDCEIWVRDRQRLHRYAT